MENCSASRRTMAGVGLSIRQKSARATSGIYLLLKADRWRQDRSYLQIVVGHVGRWDGVMALAHRPTGPTRSASLDRHHPPSPSPRNSRRRAPILLRLGAPNCLLRRHPISDFRLRGLLGTARCRCAAIPVVHVGPANHRIRRWSTASLAAGRLARPLRGGLAGWSTSSPPHSVALINFNITWSGDTPTNEHAT